MLEVGKAVETGWEWDAVVILNRGSAWASLRRWHLNKDLKEVKKLTLWVSGRRAFEVEGRATVRILRWAPVWHI